MKDKNQALGKVIQKPECKVTGKILTFYKCARWGLEKTWEGNFISLGGTQWRPKLEK